MLPSNPMSIIDQIVTWLETLSQTINLQLFVIIGSFLEEIIAPIPSPFVMTTTAALAVVSKLGAAVGMKTLTGAEPETSNT